MAMRKAPAVVLIGSLMAGGGVQSHELDFPNMSRPLDRYGLEKVVGPVRDRVVRGKHIVSDTVGVISDPAIVINSIIEADVCIVTSGRSFVLVNSLLICRQCIKFNPPNQLVNATAQDSTCVGDWSNHYQNWPE